MNYQRYVATLTPTTDGDIASVTLPTTAQFATPNPGSITGEVFQIRLANFTTGANLKLATERGTVTLWQADAVAQSVIHPRYGAVDGGSTAISDSFVTHKLVNDRLTISSTGGSTGVAAATFEVIIG